MVRKQVYIEPQQELLLKEKAAQFGVTEAELIRRAIDLMFRGRIPVPAWKDEDAWREALAFMRERAKRPLKERPRTWTREDAYDERTSRLSR